MSSPVTVKNTFVELDVQTQWTRRRVCSEPALPLIEAEAACRPDGRTTLCVFGWGQDCSVEFVAKMLKANELLHKVNFLYMPMDFRRQVSFGEVFVNAISPSAAGDLWESLKGEYQVRWASKVQGLSALIQKYRNFSVMHHDVPDEAKPRLYVSGARIPFPAPTKKLTRPRPKVQALH
ncbi:ML2 [Symbiodinium natans]|uniref:ML2 protein n=1 Tax=Symbiodinium natans TaxID=878477 RepID=A0A812T524_9DINO|nr:ML2 [Symbiodinium natans]